MNRREKDADLLATMLVLALMRKLDIKPSDVVKNFVDSEKDMKLLTEAIREANIERLSSLFVNLPHK